jgi:hypothetical protein
VLRDVLTRLELQANHAHRPTVRNLLEAECLRLLALICLRHCR